MPSRSENYKYCAYLLHVVQLIPILECNITSKGDYGGQRLFLHNGNLVILI